MFEFQLRLEPLILAMINAIMFQCVLLFEPMILEIINAKYLN